MLSIDKQTPTELISHLAATNLFDLARNESASPEYRRAATKILMDKGYPQAKHPDLALIVFDINKDRVAELEVEAIVETAIESEIPAGPLKASVTTKTL